MGMVPVSDLNTSIRSVLGQCIVMGMLRNWHRFSSTLFDLQVCSLFIIHEIYPHPDILPRTLFPVTKIIKCSRPNCGVFALRHLLSTA
jgi:hypothetical protein